MAGLHADAPSHAGAVANQILSGTGRTQQPTQTQGQSGAADQAEPEISQNVTLRVDPQDRPTGRVSSRAARKEARKTDPLDAAPNGFQPAATNQDTEATPFLELLGDVLPKGNLPQDQPGDAVKAASTSLSQLPGMTLGSNYEVTASQGPDARGNVEVKPETAETVAPNANAARASQPGRDAAPNATQQAPGTGNALWEEAVGSDVAVEPEQKAPAAAVAFAARISSRTPDPQMIAPNEAQAAIAASRFAGLDGETAKTQRQTAPVRSDQTASPARMAQPVAELQTLEEEPVAVAVFEFEDPDGSSGEPQSNAEPNANPGTSLTPAQPGSTGQSGPATHTITPDAQMAAQPQTSAAVVPQAAAVRVPSTQATQGTIAPRTAVVAKEGSNPAVGTPNASSGLAMAAPAGSSAAGGRAAANAKPAQEERATPSLEPQNEPAERASEIVRAISLNLSSKDQSVQVRLSERAGELHVTVRTPDAGLTHGLREGLADLVSRLEHGGFRAEAWRPAGGDASDRGQESPSRRGSSQQQSGKESRQQENSQDPESEAQTPKWMGELESSFQRSNSVWPPSAIR